MISVSQCGKVREIKLAPGELEQTIELEEGGVLFNAFYHDGDVYVNAIVDPRRPKLPAKLFVLTDGDAMPSKLVIDHVASFRAKVKDSAVTVHVFYERPVVNKESFRDKLRQAGADEETMAFLEKAVTKDLSKD